MEQVGALISLDRGDGNVSRVMSSELSSQVSVRGSLDEYGRTATFSRDGKQQAPSLYAFLKSLRRVAIDGYVGTPSNVKTSPLFLGTLQHASYSPLPPVADLECFSMSAQWANIPFEYTLPPNQLVTRLEVLIDVILQYDIPCDIDTLDLGNNDGGYVLKGINEGGSNHLLDWIRDFLLPIGRHIYFRPDGYMEVFYIDETRAADKTLELGDILSMKVTPPGVNDPNAVSVSAYRFAYVGPLGNRKTVVVEEGPSVNYTNLKAVSVQDHTTGGVGGYGGPTVITTGPEWKTITTTNYNGGTILNQLIEEYGYYSPLACANQQNGAGVVSYNSSFDVYQFADGTWRTEAYDSLRVVRRTYFVYTYNGTTGALTSSNEYTVRYSQIEMPTKSVSGGGVETFIAGFLNATGNAWWAGREFIDLNFPSPWPFADLHDVETYSTGYETRPIEQGVATLAQRFYTANADGQVTSETIGVQIWGRFSYESGVTVFPGFAAWKFAANPYGYTAPVMFYQKQDRGGGGFSFSLPGGSGTATRTVYDSTRYRYTAFVTNGGDQDVAGFQAITDPYFQVFEDFEHFYLPLSELDYFPLPIPFITYKTSFQTPQSHAQQANDSVRIALAEDLYPVYLQNPFCETDNEIMTVAREEMRFRSADVIDIEIPMELDINETTVLAIPNEDGSGSTTKCFVWGVDMNFDEKGGARKQIHAYRFPTNLAQQVA